ncbi:MAG TPA: tetratricopeptide repeat protein, partial [Methanothrix soehngenii]|nr:tetratricopeptide repeat protein [Methanothrix soehngenii]
MRLNRTEEATAAYQSALDITDEMLEADPQNATMWSAKGLLLYNMGIYDQAAVAFDNANAFHPDYEMAWKMKGVILASKLGRNNEAIEAFDRALKINPNDPRTWQARGDALQALGRQVEADEAYAKAQSLGYGIEPHTPQAPPVVVNVTSLGDDDFIELANDGSLSQEFNNLILAVDGDENKSIALPNFSMPPGQRIRIHFGQGESNQTDLYLGSKIDLDDAAGNLTLKDLISGIERGYMEYWTPPIQENTTEYWMKKAIELRYQGSFEESAQAYDQALQLDPENATLWIGKALDLGTIGRDDESMRAYEKALELTEETLKDDPQNALAWHRKGKILSNLGREDEASSAHETALAIADKILEEDMENTSALRIKAEALASLSLWDESLQALDKVIEINPSNYDAMGRKSEILVMMGMFNESLQALSQAIELIPSNDTLELVVYWSAKSEVLQSANRLDEAMAALDKVIELDPQNAAVWRIKGFILSDLNRNNESLAAFEEAIRLDPVDEHSWSVKAGLLSKMKRYDESLLAFDQALALTPASQPAKLAETWLLKGEALNKNGREDEAKQAYQNSIDTIDKILQNDSNNSAAWSQKGRALLKLASYDEALQAYEQAIGATTPSSISAHFPDAWIGKGDVLRAMDR